MSFRTFVLSALTGVTVWVLVRSFTRRATRVATQAARANLEPVTESDAPRPRRRATSAVQRVVIEGRQISIPLAIWDASLELDTEEKASG